MSAAVVLEVHLAGHGIDPALPLHLQAASLAGELEASEVFLTAARADRAAGDIRALGRIDALTAHQRNLRRALLTVNQQLESQNRHGGVS